MEMALHPQCSHDRVRRGWRVLPRSYFLGPLPSCQTRLVRSILTHLPFFVFTFSISSFLSFAQLPNTPGDTKVFWLSPEQNSLSRARMVRVKKLAPTVLSLAKIKKIFSSWVIYAFTLAYWFVSSFPLSIPSPPLSLSPVLTLPPSLPLPSSLPSFLPQLLDLVPKLQLLHHPLLQIHQTSGRNHPSLLHPHPQRDHDPGLLLADHRDGRVWVGEWEVGDEGWMDRGTGAYHAFWDGGFECESSRARGKREEGEERN